MIECLQNRFTKWGGGGGGQCCIYQRPSSYGVDPDITNTDLFSLNPVHAQKSFFSNKTASTIDKEPGPNIFNELFITFLMGLFLRAVGRKCIILFGRFIANINTYLHAKFKNNLSGGSVQN